MFTATNVPHDAMPMYGETATVALVSEDGLRLWSVAEDLCWQAIDLDCWEYAASPDYIAISIQHGQKGYLLKGKLTSATQGVIVHKDIPDEYTLDHSLQHTA